MKNQIPPHAPGEGSDRHHPETPPDADKRFNEEEEKEKNSNR